MNKSAITTQSINYESAGTPLCGYLASPADTSTPRPGVIVVHEWWGLDDYIKLRTDTLAELGYVALAVDMYGNGAVAETPDEAGRMMGEALADISAATARFAAGVTTLKQQPQTLESKIAAIGYCFGGATVLHAARVGMALSGVVSFHGSLGSFHTATPGSIRTNILVCHGAADALVPQAELEAFRQEMDTALANVEIISYDDALHGFTNPAATANGEKYGLPLAYHEPSDQRSWAAMQTFFKQIFT